MLLIPLLGLCCDTLGGRNGIMLLFGFKWALGKYGKIFTPTITYGYDIFPSMTDLLAPVQEGTLLGIL